MATTKKAGDPIMYADETSDDRHALIVAVKTDDVVDLAYVNAGGTVITRYDVPHRRLRAGDTKAISNPTKGHTLGGSQDARSGHIIGGEVDTRDTIDVERDDDCWRE